MGIPTLSVTDPSVLGDMLIESASYFQAATAKLISGEGEKIQAVVSAYSGDNTIMLAANSNVQALISAISNFEGLILQKIAAGTMIHNHHS